MVRKQDVRLICEDWDGPSNAHEVKSSELDDFPA